MHSLWRCKFQCPCLLVFGNNKNVKFVKHNKIVTSSSTPTMFINNCETYCLGFKLLLVMALVVILFCTLPGYHAPLDVYVELNKIATDPKIHTLSEDRPVNVCVGKEWYRYPSSFFLPGQKYASLPANVFFLHF